MGYDDSKITVDCTDGKTCKRCSENICTTIPNMYVSNSKKSENNNAIIGIIIGIIIFIIFLIYFRHKIFKIFKKITLGSKI
jgi:hypothetical protein